MTLKQKVYSDAGKAAPVPIYYGRIYFFYCKIIWRLQGTAPKLNTL